MVGSFGCGIETSVSINFGRFLDWLKVYYL